MKKILLLILFIFASCEIPYDGETIITLNMKLVNANNQPLPNQKMKIVTDYGHSATDNSTYKKNSNNDGIIKFTMFKPISGTNIILDESTEYLPVQIGGVFENNFLGLNWDIGTITLLKENELATFNVVLNQQNFNKTIEKIEVMAIKYENYYFYDSGINPFYGVFQTSYQLKKNQDFLLKYEVKNTTSQTVEKFSIPLSIGSNEASYTIIY